MDRRKVGAECRCADGCWVLGESMGGRWVGRAKVRDRYRRRLQTRRAESSDTRPTAYCQRSSCICTPLAPFPTSADLTLAQRNVRFAHFACPRPGCPWDVDIRYRHCRPCQLQLGRYHLARDRWRNGSSFPRPGLLYPRDGPVFPLCSGAAGTCARTELAGRGGDGALEVAFAVWAC